MNSNYEEEVETNEVEPLRLVKEYCVLFKRDSSNTWSIIDTFESHEDAIEYIETTSREDGYVDGYLKWEVIFRWE